MGLYVKLSELQIKYIEFPVLWSILNKKPKGFGMKKYILLITLAAGSLRAMEGYGSISGVIELESDSFSVSPSQLAYLESGEIGSGESYELAATKSFRSDDSTIQLPEGGELLGLGFDEVKPVSRDSFVKMREGEKELLDGLKKAGLEVKKVGRRRSKSVDFLQIGKGRLPETKKDSGSNSPAKRVLRKQRSFSSIEKDSKNKQKEQSGEQSPLSKKFVGGLFNKLRSKKTGASSGKSSPVSIGKRRSSGLLFSKSPPRSPQPGSKSLQSSSSSSSIPKVEGKAAKLLGLSSSKSQVSQKRKSLELNPLLTKKDYDQWVKGCYTPWQRGEIKPQDGQTLLEFFREGTGFSVGQEYGEWLEKEGQHLRDLVKADNWRQSFHQFLVVKTSEVGQSLIQVPLEESSSSVVILPAPLRSSGKSVEVSSDAAVEETEDGLSVSIKIHQLMWAENPVMQALRKVLEHHAPDKVEEILKDYAGELTSQAEDSESSQGMLAALASASAKVRTLKTQERLQRTIENFEESGDELREKQPQEVTERSDQAVEESPEEPTQKQNLKERLSKARPRSSSIDEFEEGK